MSPREVPLIFIADDDTVYLELMEELLTEEGYHVRIEQGGSDLYESAKRIQPSLIILDIRLGSPEPGLLALDLLRLDPTTRHIPILVCTTSMHLIGSTVERLQDMRCDVLSKPFHLDEMLTKIQKLLHANDS